jgi:Tfp pilus assembly protein PilN
MQIRINLHTSAGTRRRGLKLALPGAALGSLAAPFRDKFLVGAVAALAASFAGVAFLYLTQTREAAAMTAREEAAVRDSTRFGRVIAARARAVARRDSLARELRVIAAIDSTRFVWAHVLDEVSQALPAYTWLTNVAQTSAPPAPPSSMPNAKGKPAADTAKAKKDTTSGATRLRNVGRTVDLQALTQFMRDLEASPFVRNVQLAHSEPVQGGDAGSREVTEFTLDAEYEAAPREALRTVSISVPVR